MASGSSYPFGSLITQAAKMSTCYRRILTLFAILRLILWRRLGDRAWSFRLLRRQPVLRHIRDRDLRYTE